MPAVESMGRANIVIRADRRTYQRDMGFIRSNFAKQMSGMRGVAVRSNPFGALVAGAGGGATAVLTRKIDGAMKAASQAAVATALGLRDRLQAISPLGALGAGAIGAITFAAPIKAAANFEDAIIQLNARAGRFASSATLLNEKAAKLTRTLGQEFAVGASGAAQAMEELVKGGFELSQAMVAARETVRLAVAENMDMAKSAKIATNVMRIFQLQAEDMARINNVLVSSANRFTASVTDIFEGLVGTGQIAGQLNLSLEQTAAMVGMLTDAGLTGSRAGTVLRTGLNRLNISVKSTEKALRAAGIELNDFRTATGDIDVMRLLRQMQDMKLSVRALGSILLQRASLFAGIFRVGRDGRVGMDLLEDMTKLIKNDITAAAILADAKMRSLTGQVKLLASNMGVFMESVGRPFLKTMKGWAAGAISVVQALTKFNDANRGAISNVLKTTAVMAAFIGVSYGVAKSMQFVGATILQSLAPALLPFKALRKVIKAFSMSLASAEIAAKLLTKRLTYVQRAAATSGDKLRTMFEAVGEFKTQKLKQIRQQFGKLLADFRGFGTTAMMPNFSKMFAPIISGAKKISSIFASATWSVIGFASGLTGSVPLMNAVLTMADKISGSLNHTVMRAQKVADAIWMWTVNLVKGGFASGLAVINGLLAGISRTAGRLAGLFTGLTLPTGLVTAFGSLSGIVARLRITMSGLSTSLSGVGTTAASLWKNVSGALGLALKKIPGMTIGFGGVGRAIKAVLGPLAELGSLFYTLAYARRLGFVASLTNANGVANAFLNTMGKVSKSINKAFWSGVYLGEALKDAFTRLRGAQPIIGTFWNMRLAWEAFVDSVVLGTPQLQKLFPTVSAGLGKLETGIRAVGRGFVRASQPLLAFHAGLADAFRGKQTLLPAVSMKHIGAALQGVKVGEALRRALDKARIAGSALRGIGPALALDFHRLQNTMKQMAWKAFVGGLEAARVGLLRLLMAKGAPGFWKTVATGIGNTLQPLKAFIVHSATGAAAMKAWRASMSALLAGFGVLRTVVGVVAENFGGLTRALWRGAKAAVAWIRSIDFLGMALRAWTTIKTVVVDTAQKITSAARMAAKAVGTAFTTAFKWIVDVARGVPAAIKAAYDRIASAARTAAMAIGTAFTTAFQWVADVARAFPQKIKAAYDFITAAALRAARAIGAYFTTAFQWVADVVGRLPQAIQAGLRQIGAIAQKAAKAVGTAFTTAFQWIVDVARGIPAAIQAAFDRIAAVARTAATAIRTAFTGTFQALAALRLSMIAALEATTGLAMATRIAAVAQAGWTGIIKAGGAALLWLRGVATGAVAAFNATAVGARIAAVAQAAWAAVLKASGAVLAWYRSGTLLATAAQVVWTGVARAAQAVWAGLKSVTMLGTAALLAWNTALKAGGAILAWYRGYTLLTTASTYGLLTAWRIIRGTIVGTWTVIKSFTLAIFSLRTAMAVLSGTMLVLKGTFMAIKGAILAVRMAVMATVIGFKILGVAARVSMAALSVAAAASAALLLPLLVIAGALAFAWFQWKDAIKSTWATFMEKNQNIRDAVTTLQVSWERFTMAMKSAFFSAVDAIARMWGRNADSTKSSLEHVTETVLMTVAGWADAIANFISTWKLSYQILVKKIAVWMLEAGRSVSSFAQVAWNHVKGFFAAFFEVVFDLPRLFKTAFDLLVEIGKDTFATLWAGLDALWNWENPLEAMRKIWTGDLDAVRKSFSETGKNAAAAFRAIADQAPDLSMWEDAIDTLNAEIAELNKQRATAIGLAKAEAEQAVAAKRSEKAILEALRDRIHLMARAGKVPSPEAVKDIIPTLNLSKLKDDLTRDLKSVTPELQAKIIGDAGDLIGKRGPKFFKEWMQNDDELQDILSNHKESVDKLGKDGVDLDGDDAANKIADALDSKNKIEFVGAEELWKKTAEAINKGPDKPLNVGGIADMDKKLGEGLKKDEALQKVTDQIEVNTRWRPGMPGPAPPLPPPQPPPQQQPPQQQKPEPPERPKTEREKRKEALDKKREDRLLATARARDLAAMKRIMPIILDPIEAAAIKAGDVVLDHVIPGWSKMSGRERAAMAKAARLRAKELGRPLKLDDLIDLGGGTDVGKAAKEKLAAAREKFAKAEAEMAKALRRGLTKSEKTLMAAGGSFVGAIGKAAGLTGEEWAVFVRDVRKLEKELGSALSPTEISKVARKGMTAADILAERLTASSKEANEAAIKARNLVAEAWEHGAAEAAIPDMDASLAGLSNVLLATEELGQDTTDLQKEYDQMVESLMLMRDAVAKGNAKDAQRLANDWIAAFQDFQDSLTKLKPPDPAKLAEKIKGKLPAKPEKKDLRTQTKEQLAERQKEAKRAKQLRARAFDIMKERKIPFGDAMKAAEAERKANEKAVADLWIGMPVQQNLAALADKSLEAYVAWEDAATKARAAIDAGMANAEALKKAADELLAKWDAAEKAFEAAKAREAPVPPPVEPPKPEAVVPEGPPAPPMPEDMPPVKAPEPVAAASAALADAEKEFDAAIAAGDEARADAAAKAWNRAREAEGDAILKAKAEAGLPRRGLSPSADAVRDAAEAVAATGPMTQAIAEKMSEAAREAERIAASAKAAADAAAVEASKSTGTIAEWSAASIRAKEAAAEAARAHVAAKVAAEAANAAWDKFAKDKHADLPDPKLVNKMASESVTGGSIYTHDTGARNLLRLIAQRLVISRTIVPAAIPVMAPATGLATMLAGIPDPQLTELRLHTALLQQLNDKFKTEVGNTTTISKDIKNLNANPYAVLS